MEVLWHPFGAVSSMENEYLRSIYWIISLREDSVLDTILNP